MRVTMKIYFEDGSAEEQEILSKEFFDNDGGYDEESIQDNLEKLNMEPLINYDLLLEWLFDPYGIA